MANTRCMLQSRRTAALMVTWPVVGSPVVANTADTPDAADNQSR
jgi:hypothetical protein